MIFMPCEMCSRLKVKNPKSQDKNILKNAKTKYMMEKLKTQLLSIESLFHHRRLQRVETKHSTIITVFCSMRTKDE